MKEKWIIVPYVDQMKCDMFWGKLEIASGRICAHCCYRM